jgi:WD40 repeat protein
MSRDGQRVAAADEAGVVTVWNHAGEPSALWTVEGGRIRHLTFADRGRTVAVAQDNGSLSLWPIERDHASSVIATASSPIRYLRSLQNGELIAWGRDRNHTQILDTGSLQPANLQAHDLGDDSTALARNREGSLEVAAGAEQSLDIRDTSSGRILATLRGHTGPVNASAFHPDGKRVATAGDDSTIRIWDVATGEEVLTLRGHDGAVLGVAWGDHGKRLFSAGADGTLRLWQARE